MRDKDQNTGNPITPQDQYQQTNGNPVVAPPPAPHGQYVSPPAAAPAPQSVVPPVAPVQFVTGSAMRKKSGKRKLLIISAVFAFVFMLAGAAVAYFLLYYVPNRPEVVLNNAVIAFVEEPGNYNVSGKLDQAGPDDPDFTFAMTTGGTKNAKAELFMSTFLQHPQIQTVKNNDKVFIKFAGFEDFKTLAKHYRNVGKPGIQEAIAAFTESSGLAANQQKWLQVDDYILAQPFAPARPEKITGIPGASLNAIGAVETIDGKQARKYEVALNREAFTLLIGELDRRNGLPILSGILGVQEVTANEIKAQVWVDLDTKTIAQITYSGRPLNNATFDIKIAQTKTANIETVSGNKLTQQLSYGLVNGVIFNKAWQQGGSSTDKERIADLKGIKTALEMFKARTGAYPERYEMSVNQDALIGGQMKGADKSVFKDPSGRLIGKSGSQYAYVPAASNDDTNCGKFAGPCTKYFIITTLDDGRKYQLNSN